MMLVSRAVIDRPTRECLPSSRLSYCTCESVHLQSQILIDSAKHTHGIYYTLQTLTTTHWVILLIAIIRILLENTTVR